MDAAHRSSLYDRLGGATHIAAIVGDFVDRIVANPGLNANPRVKAALRHVSAAGLKDSVTEMACWATGGPQTYSGRSMADSHRHLMISENEWLLFIDDLRKALDNNGVSQTDQREFLSLMESSKDAIVFSRSGGEAPQPSRESVP